MNKETLAVLVAVVLILAGTLIVLAPVASEYHHQTLVANTLPYLWSNALRQGDDQPNPAVITNLENKLDERDEVLGCHPGRHNGYFGLGMAMILIGGLLAGKKVWNN